MSHETVGDRLQAAGLATDRYINVEDGAKRTYDHDTRYDEPAAVPGRNYGVYADDGPLVVLDIDDHDGGDDRVSAAGIAALGALPPTLQTASPHGGTHRFYKLADADDAGDELESRLGTPNPVPSWGEVQASSKYVVGAGSRLDGCGKDWCDQCAEPDGGMYEVGANRAVAEIALDTLIDALAADPELSDRESQHTLDETTSGDAGGSGDYDGDEIDRETVEDMLSELPGTQHYNEWLRTLFALLSWDDGKRGKEVAEQWSRSNEKWEEPESQRIIDDLWRNRTAKRISVGTLVYQAKAAGWEPPTDWGGDTSDEPVKETIVRHSDRFDDPSEVPDEAVPSAGRDTDTEPSVELDAEAAAVADSSPDGDDGTDDSADEETGWESVRSWYAAADDGEVQKGYAREAARNVLERQHTFLGLDDQDEPLVYDPETGVFDDSLAEIKATLRDELGEYWSSYEVNEILRGCRAANIVTRDQLDAAHHSEPLLCVENGVLNLDTGELESDHSPQYRFVSRVPVEYNPAADNSEIREFVDSLVGRDADRQALLEMVGHALHPEAHTRFQKFLILTGPTNNGKSQFFSLVRSLLNGDSVDSDREEVANNTASVKLQKIAQNRFSMNSIHGNLANIAGEIDGKKIRNTASLKDITGGDAVEVEPKGTASFFDRIHATQMFAANDPPIIGERDKAAVASRIVPVELPHTFAFPDSGRYDGDDPMVKEAEPARSLRERLHTDENLSALLNLALDGLERLRENGGDVSLPESPDERLKRYERRADPMRRFGEVCLEDDDSDYVVKQDVTEIYREWARAEGFEVGSSVHSVLHDALRGVGGFAYTDARKRSPTYDDTDLELRGYDDRQRTLTQTTLTEEGLAHARRAGLIEDGDDEAGGRHGPLTPSEVTVDAATDRGRFPTVEGRVTARYRDNYDNPKASLEGADGAVVEIEIEGPAPAALETGNVVRLTRAKVRDDDYVKLVSDPTTEVVAVSTPADGGDDQAAATTDGGQLTDEDPRDDDPERPHGPHDDAQCRNCGLRWLAGSPDNAPRRECPDCGTAVDWNWNVETGRVPASAAPDNSDTDHETVRGRVVEWIRGHNPEPVTVTKATVDLGVDADDAHDALDSLVENGRLIETETEGKYEVNR